MNIQEVIAAAKKAGFTIALKTEDKIIAVSESGAITHTLYKANFRGHKGPGKLATILKQGGKKAKAPVAAPAPNTFSDDLEGISGVGPATVAKIAAAYETHEELKDALVIGHDIDGVSATIEGKLKAYYGI
jgi:predicted flap endonuclease-1-like 5' DNA nuclease